MRHLAGVVAVLALGVVLVAGCGIGGSPSPSPSPQSGWFRIGAWTATGVLEFRLDNTWTYTFGGQEMSSGTYDLLEETLTFLTDATCKQQGAEQGTCSWSISADRQLVLKKVNDPCGVRGLFDGVTWKMVD